MYRTKIENDSLQNNMGGSHDDTTLGLCSVAQAMYDMKLTTNVHIFAIETSLP